jgi:hypothetical protein
LAIALSEASAPSRANAAYALDPEKADRLWQASLDTLAS